MQYGQFDNNANEYVISRPDTPHPWSNYIGSSDFSGSILSAKTPDVEFNAMVNTWVSWLSGAAVWNYVAMTNAILGIQPDYDGLRSDSCIPECWGEFEVTRAFRGATYHILRQKAKRHSQTNRQWPNNRRKSRANNASQ